MREHDYRKSTRKRPGLRGGLVYAEHATQIRRSPLHTSPYVRNACSDTRLGSAPGPNCDTNALLQAPAVPQPANLHDGSKPIASLDSRVDSNSEILGLRLDQLFVKIV